MLQEGDQHGQGGGEERHGGGGIGHPAQGAEGEAGQGGMPDDIRKEGHAVIDHQDAEQAEGRHDQQDGEQRLLHEKESGPIPREQVDE